MTVSVVNVCYCSTSGNSYSFYNFIFHCNHYGRSRLNRLMCINIEDQETHGFKKCTVCGLKQSMGA